MNVRTDRTVFAVFNFFLSTNTSVKFSLGFKNSVKINASMLYT
ncbi:hypothetical protein PBCV1_a634aL [Paramecium bursaria Chlorella virus 1]|uniref:Uncharacterized protein n=1 Tax=Paramecium bursaria Chlorella virus 1 TaxID=10506 RepID=F8TU75_PBCV1|nr:hypothetical protein PBCV1_a634aL [Paramecium bursaria Chlorella virus 1]AEI70136.1 hypothetical protein [Paramecium bursaria Chlorella virus 1]